MKSKARLAELGKYFHRNVSCFAKQTKIYFLAAKEKFEIDDWLEVYLVMEEDGTEVRESWRL